MSRLHHAKKIVNAGLPGNTVQRQGSNPQVVRVQILPAIKPSQLDNDDCLVNEERRKRVYAAREAMKPDHRLIAKVDQ